MYARFPPELAAAYVAYAEEEILRYEEELVSDAEQLRLEAEHFVNLVLAN
jgi:hypothetical protein